ncbi:MAG: Rpn family recombination-promoting nuclease/putative transposase [Planctomycetota bacterium]
MPNPHDDPLPDDLRAARARAGAARRLLSMELVAAIDWNSLELLPGTFLDEREHTQHVDLLFSVTIAGTRVLGYVLLEHKFGPDRVFV